LRRGTTRVRIVGADCNKYHLAAADCDERRLLPPTEADREVWLDAVFQGADAVDLILPQPDCDVAALASVSTTPEWRAKLVLPSPGAIAIAQDKLDTVLTLTAAGLPVPMTIPYPPKLTDVACETLGWPMWVRARHGAGSRGSFRAWTLEQVHIWIESCRYNKSIQPDDFILCAYLPGAEYGCQLLYWHGTLLVSQTRERVEYLYGYLSPTGQSSSPAVARTVANTALDTLADQAVRALDYEPHGVYGVDMKCDTQGRPHITEINAGRFYTTIDFLASAGLNLPEILVKLHRGDTIPVLGCSPLAANQYWVRTADCLPRLVRYTDLMTLEKERTVCRTQAPLSVPTR